MGSALFPTTTNAAGGTTGTTPPSVRDILARDFSAGYVDPCGLDPHLRNVFDATLGLTGTETAETYASLPMDVIRDQFRAVTYPSPGDGSERALDVTKLGKLPMPFPVNALQFLFGPTARLSFLRQEGLCPHLHRGLSSS